MDLRTGKMYASKEEAPADGVPESDIAHVVMSPELAKALGTIPKVEFSPKLKFSKGSFKPIGETVSR